MPPVVLGLRVVWQAISAANAAGAIAPPMMVADKDEATVKAIVAAHSKVFIITLLENCSNWTSAQRRTRLTRLDKSGWLSCSLLFMLSSLNHVSEEGLIPRLEVDENCRKLNRTVLNESPSLSQSNHPSTMLPVNPPPSLPSALSNKTNLFPIADYNQSIYGWLHRTRLPQWTTRKPLGKPPNLLTIFNG